jgi:type IV pilus assembly protein PilE
MTSKYADARGFTLIELMVVLVIVAILAALAIPSYQRYGYRARRADGQELLLRVANAQERYYATYGKYAVDPVTTQLKLGSATSEKGYYTVKLTATTPGSDYTATAAPQGQQAADVCGSLSIDSTGVKKPAASDAAANANGRCW